MFTYLQTTLSSLKKSNPVVIIFRIANTFHCAVSNRSLKLNNWFNYTPISKLQRRWWMQNACKYDRIITINAYFIFFLSFSDIYLSSIPFPPWIVLFLYVWMSHSYFVYLFLSLPHSLSTLFFLIIFCIVLTLINDSYCTIQPIC